MLARIEIKAFKSIREAAIDLGEVNVFIGANGSGKSNILEAIGVLGAAAAGRVDDEALLRRGVRPGVPALYKTSFRGERVRDAIRFGAFAGSSSYEVELNNPIDQPRPAWTFKTEKLVVEGKKVLGRSRASVSYQSLDPEQGLAALKAVSLAPGSAGSSLLKELREFAIYAPNTASLRGLVSDSQSRAPVGLAGGRLAEAVEELRHLARGDERTEEVVEDVLGLVDWVETFGAKAGASVPLSPTIPRQQRVLFFRDRFMAEGRNEVSAYDTSEGALYVLFAAVVAIHPESPKFLAVDNFDATLNPRLVRALMAAVGQWVLGSGRQLLLTCHNPLVLDGLALQDDRVRLFAVDRSARGFTAVRPVIVDDALLAKAREGWPLSRLWVSGNLGGVPNV
ncbi:MAG: AAA family ATPase [Candidatus Schekmanbacteria bacterium]|nr:AAA family ATPase [Candidatus Schekmanbacteria bacterium]